MHKLVSTLVPVGADGSAAAHDTVGNNAPAVLRYVKIDYTDVPSTTDILIKEGSSSGRTLFTRTNSNTDTTLVAVVEDGVDSAGGTVANIEGQAFEGGLYISVAQANASATSKVVVTALVER